MIQIYLDQARAVGARLILDIQPGRSTFVEEVEALLPWLAEPDVDVALDPEWNVGRRGIPGRTEGKVRAAEVNAVAAALADVVEANGLPPKLLLVHQFRRGSIRGRTKLRSPEGVQTLLNFDGIGAPGPKAAGYADLAAPPPLFNGFSLFYQRDTPVMKPGAVLALERRAGLPPLPVAWPAMEVVRRRGPLPVLAGLGAVVVILFALGAIFDLGPFEDEELSPAEFIGRGDQICKEAHDAFVELQASPPQTSREAADLNERLASIADDEREELAELGRAAGALDA